VRATGKGLMLRYDLSPDVPRYIVADERKLRQILVNLLGNAIKFTNDGWVMLQVRRSPGQEDEGEDSGSSAVCHLQFAVRDTGVGIPTDMLEAIFEPFVQANSGRWTEGTGLGLAISRQFVWLMGGYLRATSEGIPGRGALFVLDLPVRVVQESDVDASLSSYRPAVALEPGQPTYRLLVAEDEPMNRELLVKALARLGFEVRAVENGQEALAVWRSWQPDLIWMDIRMPIMDGQEATRRIKATPEGRSTIIIALTASAFEEDRQWMLMAGCDDVIHKPFHLREVEDVLTRYLGVRFVREEAAAAPQVSDERPASLDLAGLPADWLAELRRAVVEADNDRIMALAGQIRARHPQMATSLMERAAEFDYDAIIVAIDRVVPEDQ